MREILFRGKDLQEQNGWLYGYFYKSDINKRERESGKATLIFTPNCDTFIYVPEYHNSWMVKAETVGRSTEMYDQDGNKIFEGDIVRVANMFIGKIAFAAGAFGVYTGHNLNKPIDYDYLASEIAPITGCNNCPHFCYEDYFVSLYELYCNFNGEENCCPGIEVIGNIYDNPELIGGIWETDNET